MESLSDYELARLDKIAENKRMLIALGIETAAEQCRRERSTPKASAPSSSTQKRETNHLTEEQRTLLSNASQWLERFELWLRGQVRAARKQPQTVCMFERLSH